MCTVKPRGQVYAWGNRSSWYAQHPIPCSPSLKELTNPLLIAGHESAYRECRAVDVRHMLSSRVRDGIHGTSLQNFCIDELLRLIGQEQYCLHIRSNGTFSNPVTPSQHHGTMMTPIPTFHAQFLHTHLTKSPVQPSNRHMLLSGHGPVGSNLPRHPRRNLGHFTNARTRSGCCLIPNGRNSGGCVRERLESLPHGDLGVSNTGVCEQFARLIKGFPVLSLHS